MTERILEADFMCSEFKCAAKPLPPDCLPTIRDVLLCYRLTKRELSVIFGRKSPSALQISNMVAAKLMVIWQMAGIPTKTKSCVVESIKLWHQRHLKVSRLSKQQKNPRKKFLTLVDALLDISDKKKCQKQLDEQRKLFLRDQQTIRTLNFNFEGNKRIYYHEMDADSQE